MKVSKVKFEVFRLRGCAVVMVFFFVGIGPLVRLPSAGLINTRGLRCREIGKRSHVDKTILLVQLGDKFVPIAESGVIDLGAEV